MLWFFKENIGYSDYFYAVIYQIFVLVSLKSLISVVGNENSCYIFNTLFLNNFD